MIRKDQWQAIVRHMTAVSTLDAEESVFFLRQLEEISPVLHEVDYPEMKARNLIPINTAVNTGATSFTYRQYDKMGHAKIIANYAADLPRVDVGAKEFNSKIVSLGDSFGYNIQEIRASRMANYPLDQARAVTAKEAGLREENLLAFAGDDDHLLTGFLDIPNANVITIAADGVGGSTKFKDKTPEQCLRDLNLIANTGFKLTKGIEQNDTLLLPIDVYTDLTTRKIGIESETVLSFFLKKNPFIKSVDWLNELTGAGTNSTDRAIAYRRNPSKLQMILPQDYEMFPPQMKNLEWVIPGHMRFGGVVAYKPLSVSNADGV